MSRALTRRMSHRRQMKLGKNLNNLLASRTATGGVATKHVVRTSIKRGHLDFSVYHPLSRSPYLALSYKPQGYFFGFAGR